VDKLVEVFKQLLIFQSATPALDRLRNPVRFKNAFVKVIPSGTDSHFVIFSLPVNVKFSKVSELLKVVLTQALPKPIKNTIQSIPKTSRLPIR
jgi:hypothetical protein